MALLAFPMSRVCRGGWGPLKKEIKKILTCSLFFIHARRRRTMSTLQSRCQAIGMTESKNPRFLVVNHEKVVRAARKQPFKLTIVRVVQSGFASAPYKAKSKTKAESSKPLSEMEYGSCPLMRMYTFPKVGIMDKGPRSETSWTLQAGNTLKLWIDEERAKDETLMPAEIPEFSLCEMCVTSKNEESVKNGGWCIKITSIQPCPYGFHSIQRDLRSLCSSLEEAKSKELSNKAAQPLLEKELEGQVLAGFVKLGRGTSMEDVAEGVRLVEWDGTSCSLGLEVSAEVLTRNLNCPTVDAACALLEVAIVAEAAWALVIGGEKGRFCAVPVLDTGLLTQGVGAETTLASTEHDACTYDMVVRRGGEVENAYLGDAGTEPMAVPSDDFELVHESVRVAKSVPIEFILRSEGRPDKLVWKGAFNTTETAFVAAATKRRRFGL